MPTVAMDDGYVDAASLATNMLRRRGSAIPASVIGYTAELAGQLRAVAAELPPSWQLVLGGSFARGEPYCLDSGHACSDVDLLVICDAPIPEDDWHRWTSWLCDRIDNASPYHLTSRQVSGLRTAIGREYATDGVPLTRRDDQQWRHTVDVTSRDAAELAVFGVIECLERAVLGPDVDADAQYWRTRAALLGVRSVVLLDGGFAMHDRHRGQAELQRATERLLAMRDDPPHDTVFSLADMVDVFRLVLVEHRSRGWLKDSPDAIRGSEFAERPDARMVAGHQRVAIAFVDDLNRRLASRPRTGDDDIWEIAAAAWAAGNAADSDLTSFFQSHSRSYRRSLLSMKLPPHERQGDDRCPDSP